LEAAQDRNQLEAELRRLERYHLLIVDEVGYLPLERQAANLLFALVSRRYERGSIIVTSNRGFEQWGEILGDAMVAAALIDRLVHHATMITPKGKSGPRKQTLAASSIQASCARWSTSGRRLRRARGAAVTEFNPSRLSLARRRRGVTKRRVSISWPPNRASSARTAA
jgi:IstB-like ATP binding protein